MIRKNKQRKNSVAVYILTLRRRQVNYQNTLDLREENKCILDLKERWHLNRFSRTHMHAKENRIRTICSRYLFIANFSLPWKKDLLKWSIWMIKGIHSRVVCTINVAKMDVCTYTLYVLHLRYSKVQLSKASKKRALIILRKYRRSSNMAYVLKTLLC